MTADSEVCTIGYGFPCLFDQKGQQFRSKLASLKANYGVSVRKVRKQLNYGPSRKSRYTKKLVFYNQRKTSWF